jgi:site-specific recombinase XerD
MHEEAESFLRHIRQRIAVTTYRQRFFIMQRFMRHIKKINKSIHDLTRRDVESYLLTINGGQATRRNTLRVLHDFYMFHHFTDAPTHGISLGKEPRRLINVPSEAVVDEKISGISGPEPEIALRNRLSAELAYGSALRRRELSLLDIEDLDLVNRTAFIQGKGDKQRLVPITGRSVLAARDYLSGRKTSRGPLFVAYNKAARPRLSPNAIGDMFKKQTGLNAHLYRHACASHLLKRGCSTRVIQELLGHKFLTTTQRYTFINKEELKNVVAKRHPRSAEKEAPGEDFY